MSDVFFSYSTELLKYEVGIRALTTKTEGVFDCHVWVAQYDELEEAVMYEAEDFFLNTMNLQIDTDIEEFVANHCKNKLYKLLRTLSERFLTIADLVAHRTEFRKDI